jgi:hypothetical protein
MPESRFRTCALRVLTAGVLGGALMTLVGCGGSIGPLVADLQWRPDGQLEMTRCMFEVQSFGNVIQYRLRNCNKSIVPHPDAPGASAGKAATEVVVP